MKEFKKPETEVVLFDVNDVIVTSPDIPGGGEPIVPSGQS